MQKGGNEGAPPDLLQAPPGGELDPEICGGAEIRDRPRGPERIQIEKEQGTESAPEHVAEKEATSDNRVQGSVERHPSGQGRSKKQQQNVPDM